MDLGVGVEVGDDLSGMMRNGGRLERDILLRFFFFFCCRVLSRSRPSSEEKKGTVCFAQSANSFSVLALQHILPKRKVEKKRENRLSSGGRGRKYKECFSFRSLSLLPLSRRRGEEKEHVLSLSPQYSLSLSP